MDTEKYELFRENNKMVINELVDEYQTALYSFCFKLTMNKYDADDLFQKTWIKVINKTKTFKNTNFKSWLFKICFNQFKDDYKRKKNDKHTLIGDTNDLTRYIVAPESKGSDEIFIIKEEYNKLLNTINNLNDIHRDVLVMFYIEQLKYDEIASLLKIPIGTIKSRLSKAKTKLKLEMSI